MKKIILLCLIAALVFSLVSCVKEAAPDPDGNNRNDNTVVSDIGDGDGDTSTDADVDGDKTAVSARVVALADGRAVEIGASADGVLAALGEYVDVYEAPSCVHEGYDRFYTYDGFSVTTSAGEGGDIVTELLIETSGCTLANGITVGSSVDEVIAAYGEDYTESFGAMKYEFDGMTLTVVTDGTSVTSVMFSLN